jgi:glycosyltransferase involved in cell wall biosynthesis
MVMKILHTVEFYNPSVGGMQEVVGQLSKELVKLGHEVTVATTRLPERKEKEIEGVRVGEFDISGNMVRGLLGETETYQKFLLTSHFDIITNFAAQQWATDLMLPILDRIRAVKVFVPTGFSGLYLPQYKKNFEQMKIWMSKYDRNVFLSDCYQDIIFARECGIRNNTLIPNGAGEDEFLLPARIRIRQQLHIPDKNFLILHVGSHTGMKGHIEAMKIFDHAKIQYATFLIVGNHFGGGCTLACKRAEEIYPGFPQGNRDHKQLLVRELSREETVAAYKAADLFLFPSRVECSPIVLFECMAAKTPFLTTDVGNSAEIIQWSGAGRLLPTIKDARGFSHADIVGSAHVLEEVVIQEQEREGMKVAGHKAWLARFTWGKIAKEYEALYGTLLDKQRG